MGKRRKNPFRNKDVDLFSFAADAGILSALVATKATPSEKITIADMIPKIIFGLRSGTPFQLWYPIGDKAN